MVTNNFKAYLSGLVVGNDVPLIRTDGTTDSIMLSWMDYSKNQSFIALGSGDMPAKANDHSLDNDITSSLTSVGIIRTTTVQSEYVYSITQTYINNTSNSITIKEIGWLADGTTYGPTRKFLLTRKVLDTPVVIGPGESYAFTITIKV